jgi:hypothetical protein
MCKLSLCIKHAQTSQGSPSAEGQPVSLTKHKRRRGDGKKKTVGMLENNVDK